MTQSRVGVSVVSSLIVVPPVPSAFEPNLARFPPPRRFLVTPLLRSRGGDVGESPFNSGPSSISDGEPFDELLAGRGRSDGGIGRL